MYWCIHVRTQVCPGLCDHVDCSLPGSPAHGIFQARVLEWVAISFSRGSSKPRDHTQVSHIAGRHFTLRATREAQNSAWHLANAQKVLSTILTLLSLDRDNPNCVLPCPKSSSPAPSFPKFWIGISDCLVDIFT